MTPEMLARYAGVYQFPSGRLAVVKVAGAQLQIEDSASPLDRLFVAGSETVFLSSLSQIAIEFVKDSKGGVTQLVRKDGAKEERAARKADAQ